MSNSRLDKLLEMLQNQPEDPFLIYAVGFEYENLANDEEAGKYYSLILEKHPDYLPVYYQAGLFYARKGNLNYGQKILNSGIELAINLKEKKTERELRQALEDLED